MANNKFEMLSEFEQELFLEKMTDLRNDEDWSGCLSLIENMLASDDTLTRSNRIIWYFRAICLDMLFRPTEALVILKALVDAFPLQHEFASSLEVTLHNTTKFAINKFDKERNNPLIEQYYNTLRDVDYSPWGLSEIYIDYLIWAGQFDKAKQIVLEYVDLSPNDFDYLKKAIDVSQKLKDEEMLNLILNHVTVALRNNPDNGYLASLLTLSASAETTVSA